MNNKKGIIAWCLFDWANSPFPTIVTTFIFATYFTESVAHNKITGTALWGHTTAYAGLMIAVVSPIVGAIADKSGPRKPWLAAFSFLMIIGTSLMWYALPNSNYSVWLLACVFIATIGFEVGTVFYNAMLKDITHPDYLGRVSGWGWGMGYLGGLLCLVIVLFLFIDNAVGLPTAQAENVRICGPFVTVWFLIFCLPLFLYTPDVPSKALGVKKSISQGLKALGDTFKQLKDYRQILYFLIAKTIYIDGLNTLFAFGGIYFAGTFGATLSEVVTFGIAMNITAAIGAISFAWLDDGIGPKKTIYISLFGLMIFSSAALFIQSKHLFWVLALLMGLFVGPVQAASRSFMARLTPKALTTEMFGLYATTGKITSFVGPWLVASLTLKFDSQRVGMSVIVLFYIVGAIILGIVNEPKGHSHTTV